MKCSLKIYVHADQRPNPRQDTVHCARVGIPAWAVLRAVQAPRRRNPTENSTAGRGKRLIAVGVFRGVGVLFHGTPASENVLGLPNYRKKPPALLKLRGLIMFWRPYMNGMRGFVSRGSTNKIPWAKQSITWRRIFQIDKQ